MNIIISRIRYRLINKPRHRKQKRKVIRAEIPYIGPEQFIVMKRSGVMS